MLCIIDYGIGNLRSIEKALDAVGADVVRSDDPEDIQRADRVVLPGVGAFGACAGEITRRGLIEPIHEAVKAGKPFLGVCIGMQLLFDASEEMGVHRGLGILPGRIVRFQPHYKPAPVLAVGEADNMPDKKSLKIPHMGWNTVTPLRNDPFLAGLPDSAYFYFVHSYYAMPGDPSDVLCETEYGVSFPAIVQRNNVYGVQFHPEKSHDNGLAILKNFAHL
jgi:glutamine amidotransferase